MTTQTSNTRTFDALYAEFKSFDFGAGCATSYPAPSRDAIAGCAMDEQQLANAKDEALRETLAGVQRVPADQRRQLHIISGLPGAFKSSTEQRISQTLTPTSAASVDFDEYRRFVPGVAQFSQAHPMDADSVAGNAGAIRDEILNRCLDEDVHVFYPGAFKSAHKMPGIVCDYASRGVEVHFTYLAGNSSFNRLMTECRYIQSLLAARKHPSSTIIRNVREADYKVIADGSPEVVDLLEQCGRAGRLTPELIDAFSKNDPERRKALSRHEGKTIPLASLHITDRFGNSLYHNRFDGQEKGIALDVIAEEEARPFTTTEREIIEQMIAVLLEAAELELLRQEDFERINARALGPVIEKLKQQTK
jgi:hypothetical protein